MAGEYHSRDFEWEELREEIEKDPSLLYHLTPFDPSSSTSPTSPPDSDAWRSFHRRHCTGRFFKERRYLLKEFPELANCSSCNVLEVGCGNGSTVLPILRARQDVVVYACDCSPNALELAKEMIGTADETSIRNRFHTFVLDVSATHFPKWLLCTSCSLSMSNKSRVQVSNSTLPGIVKDLSLQTQLLHSELLLNLCRNITYMGFVVLDTRNPKVTMLNTPRSPPSIERLKCCIGGVDYVTMIFTLSAVSFWKMPFVIRECISVLKHGGLLLFRDYGLYDMTMLRFPPKQRVGFREYLRSDGTLSYFFSLDVVRDLFLSAGFIELEVDYCCVRSVNRHNGKNMRRVWIHGKFQRPI